MRTLWRILTKPVYLPLVKSLEGLYRAFSPSGRALFLFFAGLLIISSSSLVYILNEQMLKPVPAYGGELVEGIIGAPRFINPVLAISDADRDIASLVYSGLLRATASGEYTPNLSEHYIISDDGLTYTFYLNKKATFHDNVPLTAEDVVFTVSRVQDPALKSPLRASWEGVVAQALDEHTVQFTLKAPYAPFIQNLTLGILPKHLWQNVSAEEFPFSDLNISPVGSGPFKISSISRTPSGIPSFYELSPFSKYLPEQAFISHITLKFYQSEAALITALNAGQIDAASGISPSSISQIKDKDIRRSPLNRIFGVFFNQNQSEVLRDIEVRRALEIAIDRNTLVDEVLGGFGTPLEGPVPPSIFETTQSTSSMALASSSVGPVAAREYLMKRGWTTGEDGVLEKKTGTGKNITTKKLVFSLSTGNVPELRSAAEYLRVAWEQMGASVDVKIFDQGDLSQNVIRPRKYDALLFGEVIGRELDLFAFWDSSQRNDPGLNIALYANATVDKTLAALRETSNEAERAALYQTFRIELEKDIPAVFLYAPDFVYSISNDIKGLDLGFIETPSDRFLSIASWHRETDTVWPLFVKK